MRAFLFTFFTFFITLSLSAQIEFFVEVDPMDGSFTKIQDINELEFIQILPSMTTLSEPDGHYIFAGIDNVSINRLWSIDVTDGQTIHLPQFPVLADPMDNVAQLLVDNKNNKLYGLSWDNSAMEEYFVEVDRETGVITYISVIPDVQYLVVLPNAYTFNYHQGHYIFQGVTFSGDNKLFTIDVSDGSVVSSINFPVLSDPGDNVAELQYNHSDSTMYALHWDLSDSLEYLGTVDLVSGAFTPLFPIYDVYGIVGAPHYTVIDEINGRYMFLGATTSGVNRLYSIDLYTGAVISSPEFPILDDPDDNLKEHKFNNNDGVLYGLHWDANYEEPIDTMVMDTTVMDTTMMDTTAMDTTMIDSMTYAFIDESELIHLHIRPNPVIDFAQIYWEGLFETEAIEIEIIDIKGKICIQEKITSADSKTLDLSHLQAGIYICRLRNSKSNVPSQTIERRFIKM